MEIKVSSLLQRAKKELEGVSPQAYQESVWILSKLLNKKVQNLYLEQTFISSEEEEEFWSQIQKRKNHYPLDYLLEESYFLGHKFLIQEGVFTPRADTEVLVEKVFKQYPKEKALKMMDWGAGAGTVCLSLLSYFSNAKALAVDIHSKSLDCLKKNSELMGLRERLFILKGDVCKIDFKIADLFSHFIPFYFSDLREIDFYQKQNQAEAGSERENKVIENSIKQSQEVKNLDIKHKIDLITANPPYIDPQDNQINKSVYLFEPPIALFSNQKGMGHIYSWFYKAMECLNSGACYIFEFGWNQSKPVKDFLSANQSLALYEILKDSQGYDRSALIYKK